METRVEVWEKEKCCGNTAAGKGFHIFFKFSQTFTRQLSQNMELTCFLFLSENIMTRKGKLFVNFDYLNANSLCLLHHYVNSSCLVLCSIEF